MGGNNVFPMTKNISCCWMLLGKPYELVFYDFSNPMNVPYKELFRVEVNGITN
ncbi:hypothetical protein PCURB6_44250 [Paenibacillus curdlanolyticus]|nr:hypothetical protein PCURB6_44250 [Paenibacillus curdlanolyticus]